MLQIEVSLPEAHHLLVFHVPRIFLEAAALVQHVRKPPLHTFEVFQKQHDGESCSIPAGSTRQNHGTNPPSVPLDVDF